jgi:hypothetical protein
MFKTETNKAHVKQILEMLKGAGADKIIVGFDGSGDSGSVHSVDICDEQGKALQLNFGVVYAVTSSTWKDGKWEQKEEDKMMPVKEALETFCYDMLEKTGIDWYNNDGGFGELTITLDPVEVQLEVNQRYTEYNTDIFELNAELEEKE